MYTFSNLNIIPNKVETVSELLQNKMFFDDVNVFVENLIQAR